MFHNSHQSGPYVEIFDPKCIYFKFNNIYKAKDKSN